VGQELEGYHQPDAETVYNMSEIIASLVDSHLEEMLVAVDITVFPDLFSYENPLPSCRSLQSWWER